MKLSFFAIWVVAITIAGCATFHSRPISAASNASALEARSLDNPGLHKFMEQNLNRQLRPWPPRSWDFSMLTLAALYYSPDLDVARAKRQVAVAGKITAGERPNPTISVLPGGITNPPRAPWIFSLITNVPIETAGKRGYRLAVAGHLARAARLDMETAAWQVRSRLRASLADLCFNRETAAVLKRQVQVQGQLVQMLSVMLANGEIPRPELASAQISLDAARLKLADLQRQIADSRARLAASLGVPVEALRPIKISCRFLKRFPVSPPLGRLRRKALLNRPDILSLLADYEAAQSALQLEIAKQYPDVNLGPGYSFQDSENYWTFGPTLTLPVLNQNQGPIAQAKARREEAAAAFTAFQAKVIAELDRGFAGYRLMRDKLKTAQALKDLSKAQMDSAKNAFRQGETSRLALLEAQLVYSTDLLRNIQASYQAQQALGLLEDALEFPLCQMQNVHKIVCPANGENLP
ncbi:MAG: TolC family protein [Syntrophobacteraceae bacterium]